LPSAWFFRINFSGFLKVQAFQLCAVGVSNHEKPGAVMGRSNAGSSKHSPFRIHPHSGQVSENSAKPPRSEHWRVLHKDESRSNLTNDSGHFQPKAGSFAVDSCARSALADVLAGKSSGNDIDTSAPCVPIKSSHVVPNRESFEHPIPLAVKHDLPRSGIKLNSADGAPSKQVRCQDAAPPSCKKCQLIHFCPFFAVPPSPTFRP